MVDQRPFDESPPTAGPGEDASAERAQSANPVTPRNRITDPTWGVQTPAGGANMPDEPDISTEPC